MIELLARIGGALFIVFQLVPLAYGMAANGNYANALLCALILCGALAALCAPIHKSDG